MLEPLPKELQAACIAKALESKKPISVLGYGVTTRPIVAFLNMRGVSCVVYDDKAERACASTTPQGIESIAGSTFLHSSAFCAESSVLEILSPGIPPHHTHFAQASRAVSEYDFIWWLRGLTCGIESSCDEGFLSLQADNTGTIVKNIHKSQALESPNQASTLCAEIWISGTNGKTTTTQMLAHILASYGARAGGNIGTPLIALYEERARLWVLETSSFALHYTKAATPRIYALLPLSQDHISWHNGFEGYVADKLSPLARMGVDSVAILPSTLRNHRLCRGFAGEKIFYADSSDLYAFLCARGVIKQRENPQQILPFFEPFLLDAYIALSCAVALAQIPSNTSYDIATCIADLRGFTIGAHRMEEVFIQDRGVQWLFIDDSKGTNTDATLQAIKRYKDRALFVILGGDDKGADCGEIFALLQSLDNVEIFTIGSNEPKLVSLAGRYNVKATACGCLQKAMEMIYQARDARLRALESTPTYADNPAQALVDFARDFACLLSPAAASLDQFSSYKERGDAFKSLAQSLATTTKGLQ